MKSRRNDDLSSFELLLDTMCNTFGGIVFIALLITILSESVDNHAVQATAKSDIEQKIEQVKRAVTLKDEQEKIEQDIKEHLYSIESAKNKIKALEKKIDNLNKEIAKSKTAKRKERQLRLPRLHMVDKSPVFIAVRHGRFYAVTNISYSIANLSSNLWGSSARGYDDSDVFIREDRDVVIIDLLPTKGQIIERGAENFGKMQQALLNINPAKEFINFAVYPDSFAEFNYVKEMFINRGFDYNWSIIKQNLSLVKGIGQAHAQ